MSNRHSSSPSNAEHRDLSQGEYEESMPPIDVDELTAREELYVILPKPYPSAIHYEEGPRVLVDAKEYIVDLEDSLIATRKKAAEVPALKARIQELENERALPTTKTATSKKTKPTSTRRQEDRYFTAKEREKLEAQYEADPYPSADVLLQLAADFNVSVQKLRNWFNTHRYRQGDTGRLKPSKRTAQDAGLGVETELPEKKAKMSEAGEADEEKDENSEIGVGKGDEMGDKNGREEKEDPEEGMHRSIQ
jgi:hypothetical protein